MPHGPDKITRVRQVAIPGELLRAVGLELGDNVHFRLSDNDPHVIEIVPSDIVARRYQAAAWLAAAGVAAGDGAGQHEAERGDLGGEAGGAAAGVGRGGHEGIVPGWGLARQILELRYFKV
jgi:bifunctional DNA-binding transcriptional regulator/antitoxin component of YhaV-PrlF toxin-antitoxin module